MITARNAERVRETACFGKELPRCCALSRDGRSIAVGTALGIQLHETERLELRHSFRTPSRIDALDFAPDGRVLWAVEEKELNRPQVLRAWDWPSGSERRATALPPPTSIGELQCSARGGFLILRGTIWFQLLDLGRGGLLTLPGGCHAITPDEKVIAVGVGDRVCLLDALTHAQLWQLQLDAKPSALAFSPDGRWLAIAAGSIQLHDLEVGRVAHTIEAAPPLEHLAFSEDGALLAIEDGRIVEAASGRTHSRLALEERRRLRPLAFTPDRRRLLTGPRPRLWEVESGAPLAELAPSGASAPAALVACLAASGDRAGGLRVQAAGGFQTEFSTGAGGRIEVVELATSQVVSSFESPAQSLLGLALSSDGRLVAAQCVKGRLDLLALASGRLLRALVPDGPGADPSCPRFSPDGSRLAGSLPPGHAIGVWRADGKLVHRLQGHTGSFELAFHPREPLLASASLDRSIRIWDLDHGSCLRVLPGGPELRSLAFTDDGEQLVARTSDGTVQVFSEAEGAAPAISLDPPLASVLPALPPPEPERAHDRAWTAERARVLGARVAELLARGRVACESCGALAREYVAGTDSYGAPGWAEAARLQKTRLELTGILREPGPRFLAVLGEPGSRDAIDLEGSCPSCHRRWRYHVEASQGRLTLWTR